REIKSVRSFKEGIESNRFNVYERGMSYFTYRLLDETFNRYFAIMDFIEEKIDKIEDRVIERPDKVTAQDIFSMKKTLIFFHKALTTNRDVVTSIEKEYISQIDKKNIKRFRTLYNDVTQLIDMVGTQRDIMTGTLDLYVSSVSKNLNETIKTLTVIASFVLIPTLIASIYGMNFDTSSPWNMPELAWEYGYVFSLGLMVASMVIIYIYFRKKGWM
ncbi:MAG TPA: CorA family divalent cation transporter, partial [Candidatus Nanoarchaeia archaeon]|nr:CorA family divalent cation transporter [Candidatus Nanoarchaeia archaeon]